MFENKERKIESLLLSKHMLRSTLNFPLTTVHFHLKTVSRYIHRHALLLFLMLLKLNKSCTLSVIYSSIHIAESVTAQQTQQDILAMRPFDPRQETRLRLTKSIMF